VEEDEENNIKNENITTLANEIINNSNNLQTINEINEHINNNYNEIKKWLMEIDLQKLYNNFIDNNIYNINQLIDRMKSNQTRLNISDIESLLKIDKKGYGYRILVKLEIDAGIIDSKISKFFLKSIDVDSGNNNKNNLKLSISQDYNCYGCCKMNFLKSLSKKNDLKSFLFRYGLMDLYQNFYHNGFECINFVLLQMYSSYPINNDILENFFHIYNYEKRKLLRKALVNEVNKINYFLNTKEYNDNPNKDIIKYENLFFEEKNENFNFFFQKNNTNKKCNECLII
jgi:hypothetical protein